MQPHELAAVIRQKNKAWAALAAADKACLRYQTEHATGDGPGRLPATWEDRRGQLEAAYQDARARYVRAMLGRR